MSWRVSPDHSTFSSSLFPLPLSSWRNVMPKLRAVVMFVVTAILLVAVYLFMLGLGLIGRPPEATVKPVPEGAQELAWISPATNAGTWARIVEASERIERLWATPAQGATNPAPHIQVDATKAFSRENGEVPELVFSTGEGPKLYLRWYKTSSQNDINAWVTKLCARGTPPLGIIGGENTDRALDIAKTLQNHLDHWHGKAPAFLITTATADKDWTELPKAPSPFQPAREGKLLMDVYPERSFRFSFTNTVMTEGVMDFIDENPDLWPYEPRHALAIITGLHPLVSATILAVDGQQAMYALAWDDNKYSKDLHHQFREEFRRRHKGEHLALRLQGYSLEHSIGDGRTPNPEDIRAASLYLEYQGQYKFPRQILALPTGAEAARRYLLALTSMAPTHARRIVAVSGDSIGFNDVYRDRDFDWNVLDLPVPLVFFCHRNPMEKAAGFHREPTDAEPWGTTGTDDLLFYQDLLEAVILAATKETELVTDADEFRERLQKLRWVNEQISWEKAGPLLFNEGRDRNPGTGERIVCVRPYRDGTKLWNKSTISVWARNKTQHRGKRWEKRGKLENVFYNTMKPN